MTREEVLSALCSDEEVSKLSPSKTKIITTISDEFDFKNPELCFRGMLVNRPTGDKSLESSEATDSPVNNKSSPGPSKSPQSNRSNTSRLRLRRGGKRRRRSSRNIVNRNHIENGVEVVEVIDGSDEEDNVNGHDNHHHDHDNDHEEEDHDDNDDGNGVLNGNHFDEESFDSDDPTDKSYKSHKKKEPSECHILLRNQSGTSSQQLTEMNGRKNKRKLSEGSDENLSTIKVKSEFNSSSLTSPQKLSVKVKIEKNENNFTPTRNRGGSFQNGSGADSTISSTVSICSVDSDS